MRIESDLKLDYKDVLLKPKRSKLTSRKDVDMEREFKFLNSGKEFTGIPIIASSMDGVGTFSMAKILQNYKMLTVLRKHYEPENWDNAVASGLDLNYVSICTGTNRIWDEDASDFLTLKVVLEKYPEIPFITIDVANGYHENFVDFVGQIREEFPEQTIIAGNVITAEMTEELILRGADIVKCGIGPGSVCTTRLMTGVGIPQFSGIIECADAAHGVGGQVIADGGCVYPGDVAKAFGAGSDFVMLGGMLAGHEESEIDILDGKMEFYGMSSDRAMEIHGARKDGYRGAEGKEIRIPYKGKVEDTMTEIIGGVRSACTYIGATKIKDMPKCATFVQVLQQENQVFNLFE
ncbi:MAG: GMP reductase [SAR202 cluster bacterium]|jgi:GMP reductase|nr:GMP reductase [SAR202 cluster bacterium]HJO60019.1 GMP reductase [SAR202 cluster bacterium]|tara:strand:- start:12248 stop:13294 length:1047 start_codon:yes stop_codon:yes gene_type:complete